MIVILLAIYYHHLSNSMLAAELFSISKWLKNAIAFMCFCISLCVLLYLIRIFVVSIMATYI